MKDQILQLNRKNKRDERNEDIEITSAGVSNAVAMLVALCLMVYTWLKDVPNDLIFIIIPMSVGAGFIYKYFQHKKLYWLLFGIILFVGGILELVFFIQTTW